MRHHILLLDPAPAMQALLLHNLEGAGYRVSCALDVRTALALLAQDAPHAPDLLLLEWELPDACGIALLRQLRQDGVLCDLPIIMASARDSEQDKVLALESGADDYLCKPFGPREMLARVHALLRRRTPLRQHGAPVQAALRLDPQTLRVTAGKVPINLGRVEFKLLHFLMDHPGRVHSRAQLLDQVWGHAAYLDERTVDAHVGRLRHALQPGGCGHHIETVRGSGYRYLAAGAAVCA